MKLRLIALLIVVLQTGSIATVAHIYGTHSTPGIWLFLVSLPGTGVAAFVGSRIEAISESDSVFYVMCAAANWVFYFYLLKGAMLLKGKLSK